MDLPLDSLDDYFRNRNMQTRFAAKKIKQQPQQSLVLRSITQSDVIKSTDMHSHTHNITHTHLNVKYEKRCVYSP